MGKQVTLTIPDELYQRAEKLAILTSQDVTTVLVNAIDLDYTFPDNLLTHEPDEAVDREHAAYLALHPMLWQEYPGQHVAIYGGELVDHDPDGVALSRRIYERFPNDFVLIRQVEVEPDRVLQMRSPRFAHNDPYRFAGMWADMTEEENQLFDEIIASRRPRR
jgi:hypothetical protein